MKKLTPLLVASTVALSLASTVAVLTAAPSAQRDQQNIAPGYSREAAQIVARKLYLAILSREPDGPGLTQATAELQRGNLERQISGMVSSPEFASRIGGKAPAALLEQIYKGLFGRAPDSGGVRTYLQRIEQRKYTDVIKILVESPEFDRGLPDYDERNRPARVGRGAIGIGREDFGPPPAPNVALPCIDAVLEVLRRESGGRVLARFDEPELLAVRRSVDEVSGLGIEVLGLNRRFSYRCEVDRLSGLVGRPSVSYQMGRVDASPRIPSVLDCQDAVSERARRERGQRDLVFETGAIVPMGREFEVVRGVAREDLRFGGSPLLEYACELDRGRVTSATVRFVR